MLRHCATVAFAVGAMLIFAWKHPAPTSTVVLDAFAGFAEFLDGRESECSRLCGMDTKITPARLAKRFDVTPKDHRRFRHARDRSRSLTN